MSVPTSATTPAQPNRHQMLQDRVGKLINVPGYVGIIDASSGMGKSYCAGQLVDLLVANDTQEDHVFHYSAQETDDGYAVIEWLHDVVGADIKPRGLDALRAFYNRGPIRGLGKIIAGIIKDAGTYFEAENTSEAIADYIGSDIMRTDVERAGSERLGQQIAKVRGKLDESDRRYYVVVEGVERLALPGLRVLHDLAKNPSANLRLMLLTDRHLNVAKQHAALREFFAMLQVKHMAEISTLSGLTVPEIQTWFYQVRSISITDADAFVAYRNSDGGRPDILNSWLQSSSTNAQDVLMHGVAAWETIKLKTDGLSAVARDLLETMACAHPNPLTFEQLQAMCSQMDNTLSNAAISAAVRELLACGDLIKDVGGKIGCANTNVCKFVKSEAGETGVNYRNGLILDIAFGFRTGHRVLPEIELQRIPGNLQLADLNDMNAISSLLGSVQQSLDNGSYAVAEKLLASLESLPNNPLHQWNANTQVQHAKLRADLAGQYGDFNKAINWAEQGLKVAPTVVEKISLQISLGDKLLQLGKYNEAFRHFNLARRCAREINDEENFVQTVIQVVKLLSDIGRYGKCTKILEGLAKSLPKLVISERTRCLATRWIARIYSFQPSTVQSAQVYAKEALRIAQRMGKQRHIGNCQFVLGEVYRRRNKKKDAEASYEKALEAARLAGNKDLEAYSLLGMTLLSAPQMDGSFRERLDEVRLCLEYDAPIEKLYVDVLETLTELSEDDGNNPIHLDNLIRRLEANRKMGLAKSLKETQALSNKGWRFAVASYNWNNFVL